MCSLTELLSVQAFDVHLSELAGSRRQGLAADGRAAAAAGSQRRRGHVAGREQAPQARLLRQKPAAVAHQGASCDGSRQQEAAGTLRQQAEVRACSQATDAI